MIKRLFIAMGVLITVVPSSVWALPAEIQGLFNRNILYYNKEICASGTTTGSAAVPGPVYFIGDSIGVGIQAHGFEQNLKAKDPNWSISRMNVEEGISLSGALPKIDADKDAIAAQTVKVDGQDQAVPVKAIVVELGTNPGGTLDPNVFTSQVSTAIGKLRAANADAAIYWVNIGSTGAGINYTERNTVLKNSEASAGAQGGLKVIDWAGKGIPLNTLDNVHPTDEGYTKLSQLVADAVAGGGSAPAIQAAGSSSDCTCKLETTPSGGSGGLAYNIADETKATAAFNKYIEQHSPANAGLRGFGADFVAAGKASNVNPAFMMALAQKESGFADPSMDAKSAQPPYYNPFGLTADEGEPSTPLLGAHKWRDFNSYKEAIFEEAKYLRRRYLDQNITTINGIMPIYAPPSENNTELYTQQIKDWMFAMLLVDPSAFGSNPAGVSGPVAPGSQNCNVGFSGGGNSDENKKLGQQMAAARGWTDSGGEWNCLLQLWTRESGWRTDALNDNNHTGKMEPGPSGNDDAYGIPQSLPPSKMAAAGPDWITNPATQIKWGLDYIAGRYQTPCGAWNHSEQYNWY